MAGYGDSAASARGNIPDGLSLLASALARVAAQMSRPARNPLVRDVFDAYLLAQERAGGLAPATMEVLAHARAHLWATVGERKAEDVGKALSDELLASWVASGLRPSTARNRLGKVLTAWRWALELGMVERAWAGPSRAKARAARPAQGKRPYRVEELARLLQEIREPYALPVRLLAETGQRSSEILALDASAAFLEPDGWWVRVADAKSGAARDVPLLRRTAEALGLEHRQGALFRTTRGRPLTARQLGAGVRRALKALDLLKPVGPDSAGTTYSLDVHGLRRSWSDHAERAGIDSQVICDVAGWSRPSMQARYRRGSTTPERKREAVEALSAWRSRVYLASQAQPQQGVSCPPTTDRALTGQGVARGRTGSPHDPVRLAPLGSTTRTSPFGGTPRVRIHTGKPARNRAVVRLRVAEGRSYTVGRRSTP